MIKKSDDNMSDIEISVRINDYFKVHSNDIHDEELKWIIEDAIRQSTKHIKDLSISIGIVEDNEQEAIDIGKSILNLIDKQVEERIERISISRD